MTYPLVVLFLGDLLHLVQQLTDAQLQLTQLVLSLYLLVVHRMLSH